MMVKKKTDAKPTPMSAIILVSSIIIAPFHTGITGAVETSIIEPRVVGGNPVNRVDVYPFYSRIDVNGQFTCGGSLIAPEWILTAAHCVEEAMDLPKDSKFSVVVGATRQAGTGTSFNVKERIKHPEWNPLGGMDFDLALIHLDGASYTPTASLNNLFEFAKSGDDLTVIGMGRQFEKGPLPGELYEAAVQFVDHKECKSDFPFWLSWMISEESMLCSAGETSEGDPTDACQGDSGGPLMIRGTNIQVGVVSWGRGCGSKAWYDWDGSPGIYARVSSATDWIREAVCKNSIELPLDDFCDPKPEEISDAVDLPVGGASACEDPTATFNDDGEARTCEWLGDGWFRSFWMCMRNDQAKKTCPGTCGVSCVSK